MRRLEGEMVRNGKGRRSEDGKRQPPAHRGLRPGGKSEVRYQRTEIRGQRSEVGGQWSEGSGSTG